LACVIINVASVCLSGLLPAGFFVLQLFVSVTIEKFSEMHQQQGKCALLTPQQEGWLRIERLMADINLKVCTAGTLLTTQQTCDLSYCI
jgi:hypothetical protein